MTDYSEDPLQQLIARMRADPALRARVRANIEAVVDPSLDVSNYAQAGIQQLEVWINEQRVGATASGTRGDRTRSDGDVAERTRFDHAEGRLTFTVQQEHVGSQAIVTVEVVRAEDDPELLVQVVDTTGASHLAEPRHSSALLRWVAALPDGAAASRIVIDW